MENEFNNALKKFITDFSSRGAVKHLCDNGYTIDEIKSKLDYPISKNKIAEIVFNYYIEMGILSLEEPTGQIEKASFVKEQNEFGKVSFIKITEKKEINPEDYIECNFGKQLYKEKKVKDWESLPTRLQEHLKMLPWPLTNVWVRKDFLKKMSGKG